MHCKIDYSAYETMNKSIVPINQALMNSFDLVEDWLSACQSDDASAATLSAYRIGIEI